jgi:RNA polymerase sigma-70 factor (ECF subfamily)
MGAASSKLRRSPLSLVRAPSADDDARLVEALQRGDLDAPGQLFDRYGVLVNRVLLRILGGGADHDDRVQETFYEALRSVASLRDGSALKPWITTIAVRVARAELRRRKVRRFLRVTAPDELPEVPDDDDPAARELLRETWRVLDTLPVDERLAFTLRYVHGEELTDVARACDCSLATVKRWLARAEQRFVAQCKNHPELARRLAQGGRWSPP